ncbi:MAG: zinc metallopeptidase [Gammaproteobacteria bacterium]
MHYALILLLVLSVIFGPQLWARYTFNRYNTPLARIPGTGAELAAHLIQRFALEVRLEKAGPEGDHYDPRSRTVRLSPQFYDNNSLSAIAVAAHEVGHAIQHHRQETMLETRTRLAQLALYAQKFGTLVIIALPIVTLLTRAPASGFFMAAIFLLSMAMAVVVNLITLPVELDASFGKALPILIEGNYIDAQDLPAVRRVLRAAALTYVAASLASLLNLWRWLAILRR